jgi:preprotein translocase subunit Sec61beta
METQRIHRTIYLIIGIAVAVILLAARLFGAGL